MQEDPRAFGVLLALVVLLWAVKAYRDAHYFDNYDPSAPLNITVGETTEVNKDTPEKGYTITRFTFDAYRGEKIPTLMSLPMNRSGKKLAGRRLPARHRPEQELSEGNHRPLQPGGVCVCVLRPIHTGRTETGREEVLPGGSGGVRGNGPPRPSTRRGGLLIIS